MYYIIFFSKEGDEYLLHFTPSFGFDGYEFSIPAVEKTAEDLVKKFELFGSDPKSLYLLDNELGSRVYTPHSNTL